MLTFIKQDREGGGSPICMLEGIGYKNRKTMQALGWTWIRGAGCNGVWEAPSEEVWQHALDNWQGPVSEYHRPIGGEAVRVR